MKKSITTLLVSSLLIAGLAQVVTMVFETPLRWTKLVVCGDGDYEFETTTQTVMTEEGPANGQRIFVYCVTDVNRVDVTAAARWTLYGFWVIVCFVLIGLRMIRVTRWRTQPTPSPELIITSEEATRLRTLATTHRLQAINQVRRLTGAGLQEAKNYVDRLLAE